MVIFDNYASILSSPSYSLVSAPASSNTTMWQVRSGNEDKRSVTVVDKRGPAECPTVWRHWTYDAAGAATSKNLTA